MMSTAKTRRLTHAGRSPRTSDGATRAGALTSLPPSLADEARDEDVEQSSVVLLKPRRRDLSRDDLVDACLEPLARALGECCLWSKHGRDWRVGDYRTVVLSTSVGNDPVSVYWWSEPLEAVHVGVTCGGVPDATREYFTADGRTVLDEFGYRRDEGLGWFFKDQSVRTTKQARAVAREALAIAFDVLDYRGRAPLGLITGHGTRVERDEVYPLLTPQDLLKLLALFGCDARLHVAEAGKPPFCEVRERRGRFTVILDWPQPGNRYSTLRFAMPVKERTPLSLATLNAINEQVRFVKVFRDRDDELHIAMDVRVAGGVTAAHLRCCLADWDGARREVKGSMKAAWRTGDKTRPTRPRRRSEFWQRLEAALASAKPPTLEETLAAGDELFGEPRAAAATRARETGRKPRARQNSNRTRKRVKR